MPLAFLLPAKKKSSISDKHAAASLLNFFFFFTFPQIALSLFYFCCFYFARVLEPAV